jgi:hypothetical protein
MKRIIGFFTILFLVMAFAEISFGAHQEMMKKQTNMMASKQPTIQKQRKKIKNPKARNYHKSRKIVRKPVIK